MLVDHQIRAAIHAEHLIVDPVEGIDLRIQPASLDVRLGKTFAAYAREQNAIVDASPLPPDEDIWRHTTVEAGGHYVLHPGEFVLAHTLERIQLSDTIQARVEGKSSLGRLGVLVHATAGFIDPGWALATITLELSTVIGVPVILYPGMPIAQLAFQRTAAPSQSYAGKYVGQRAPMPSQYHLNWSGERWM